MILENVPSAGFIPVGVTLRQAATRAISYAEIQAHLSPGTQVGAELRDFFLKCADLCPVQPEPEFVGPVQPQPAAKTAKKEPQ